MSAKGKEEDNEHFVDYDSYSDDYDVSAGYSTTEEDADDLGHSEDEAFAGLTSVHRDQQAPFEVLSPLDIIARQEAALERIRSVLPLLPVFTIRLLLQYFKWDANKCLERYTVDPQGVSEEIGLPDNNDQSADGHGECEICLDDEEDLTGLGCGHKFCADCWQDYLVMHVREKTKAIPCPGQGCSRMVDELTVVSLLDDDDQKARFKGRLVESFVDDNPYCRWCPAPRCEAAVILYEVQEHRNEAVQCTCGHRFCFRCGEADHRPNSCRMMREWAAKQEGGDGALNDQLIATISRRCPKCDTNIQKNGGCNHVECTLCGFHFCWLCMSKFGSGPRGGPDGYNTHRCSTEYKDDDSVLLKKEELKRFRSYVEMFEGHARSYALENRLLDRVDTIITDVCERYGMSRGEMNFYVKALHQLLDNRHLVINSYIYGYFRPIYVEKAATQEIFEYVQKDLQRHTEQLSGLLEDSSPESIKKNQKKILHQVEVARSAYNMMLASATEWGFVRKDEVEPEVTSEAGAAVERLKAKRKPSSFFRKLFIRRQHTENE